MPKYAQFDSSSPDPSPVLGWFDTDNFHYPNLPSASDLITLNEFEWAAHFNEPSCWSTEAGKLIPPEIA